MSNHDAIIIGSGAGELTAAMALAQVGKKVPVLEHCGQSRAQLSHARYGKAVTKNGASLTFLPSDGNAVSVSGLRI